MSQRSREPSAGHPLKTVPKFIRVLLVASEEKKKVTFQGANRLDTREGEGRGGLCMAADSGLFRSVRMNHYL